MKAWIISNGTIEDYSFYKQRILPSDYIICADGGALHAARMGILPDVIMGDLDSIAQHDLQMIQSEELSIIKYPAHKDETDTQLAVEYALEKGYNEIILIGSLGTRFDHSFANISLLKLIASYGAVGVILNEHNEIYLINNKQYIQGDVGDIISLLPVSEVVDGITTTGLEYALKDAQMTFGIPYGVSNVMVSDEATVTVRKGLLLLIKAKD